MSVKDELHELVEQLHTKVDASIAAGDSSAIEELHQQWRATP